MGHGLRTSGARRWLAGTACVATLLAAGGAGGQDSSRMTRDLAVMEGILSSLCGQARPDGGDGTGDRPFWRGQPAVTAVHVDGYGPVFLLEDCLAAEPERAVVGVLVDGHSTTSVRRTLGSGAGTGADTSLAATRQVVADFLVGYGGTMGALGRTDRVTVLARRGPGSGWPLLSGSGEDIAAARAELARAQAEMRAGAQPAPRPEPSVQLQLRTLPAPSAGAPDLSRPDSLPALPERRAEPAQFRLQMTLDGSLPDSLAVLAERAAQLAQQQAADWRESLTAQMHRLQESAAALQDSVASLAIAGPWRRAAAPALLLAATVSGADLRAHRRGELSDEQLRRAIAFSQPQTDSAATQSVDIMADILLRSIGSGGSVWAAGPTPLATYCPGLGAVFVLDEPGPAVVAIGQFLAQHGEDAGRQRQAEVDRCQESLISAIADYGPTVRPLQDGEQLIVVLRLGGLAGAGRAARLTLTARRGDLEAYRRGVLDRAQLAERIRVERS